MRIAADVDQETFARKQTELRDRLASITLQLEAVDRSRSELADVTIKVLEFSRALPEQCPTADYGTERRILEASAPNRGLHDGSLFRQMKKPFDVLAEGLLVPSSRAGGI